MGDINMHRTFYENRDPLDISFYKGDYNKYRRNRAILILCCLETQTTFKKLDKSHKMDIVHQIERSCYNETCNFIKKMGKSLNWNNPLFVNYYGIIAYKIQKNIEYSKDHGTKLINDICTNNKTCLGKMTSQEMHPEVSAEIHNEIKERMKQKIQKKISTQHHCFSCDSWRTTEQEIQSRSLDEGSTLIISCETEGCSNRWTISS
jgi:DNA-directed RNA polymerase subunit M/transcription elongation factor TFIIS